MARKLIVGDQVFGGAPAPVCEHCGHTFADHPPRARCAIPGCDCTRGENNRRPVPEDDFVPIGQSDWSSQNHPVRCPDCTLAFYGPDPWRALAEHRRLNHFWSSTSPLIGDSFRLNTPPSPPEHCGNCGFVRSAHDPDRGMCPLNPSEAAQYGRDYSTVRAFRPFAAPESPEWQPQTRTTNAANEDGQNGHAATNSPEPELPLELPIASRWQRMKDRVSQAIQGISFGGLP